MKKITHSQYPHLLQEIPDPPAFLYQEGVLPHPDNKLLAVVGSRKYTDYGKRICETFIRDLRGYPITIVSGLALGIDSIAHRAALKADLQTIAIPGSGLDPNFLYPASHRNLSKEIIKRGGGLLSECEPKTPGYPSNFPSRNRIIAGMSHATLIIEAQIKSGTLITARLALDYNRDVLTVPGSIFSQTSEGPHDLIRHGATPITCAGDILEALDIKKRNAGEKPVAHDLNDAEKKILDLLVKPLSRDELAHAAEISAQEISVTLSILEIKNIIKESMGKIYRV